MDFSRRELVGLCVGLGVGSAGCLSDRSNVRYPESDAGSSGRPLVDENRTVTERAPEQVDQSPINRRLASELERVDEELNWFAREYDDAVAAYRRALARAIATVERVRDESEINSNTIGLVESAAENVQTVTEEELGAHFDVERLVAEGVADHLETLRKFAGRGDLDRADEELARLAGFYRQIRNELFVKRSLSDRQIDNRLYRRLHDGDDERPGFFELYHGPTGFGAYAYDGPRFVERDPFPEETLSPVSGRFEMVSEPAGREAYAYVLSYTIPSENDQPDPLDPTAYESTSLFLQRYRDAAASGRALSGLLDGAVTQEGRYSFGRDQWRRVYYTYDGDVVYAFLIRAGRYLLAAAPSRVAWEERVDWTGPLDRTWLWRR